MLEEEEGKRPDFATLKEWLRGKPCSQPETRPSNASTEASIEPPDPYLSIVSVSQEPIHPSTSLSRADPSLIESIPTSTSPNSPIWSKAKVLTV